MAVPYLSFRPRPLMVEPCVATFRPQPARYFVPFNFRLAVAAPGIHRKYWEESRYLRSNASAAPVCAAPVFGRSRTRL